MDTLPRLMDETSVIRPAAVLPDSAARDVLVELAHHDVRGGGCWSSGPVVWERYDRPWNGGATAPRGDAELLGSLQIGYGTPTHYAITLYRATVTALGRANGWTVESLCDDVLAFGGYTLAGCPRATMAPVRGRRSYDA